MAVMHSAVIGAEASMARAGLPLVVARGVHVLTCMAKHIEP